MRLNCQQCGGPIPRQIGPGGRRKFCEACSPTRNRPDRKRRSPAPRVVTATNTGESVLEATRAELDAAKVTESVMGQCALILARHIDAGQVNGSGLASLVKAHRETMAAALAAAPAEEDPLSRLRRLRQQPSNPTTGA